MQILLPSDRQAKSTSLNGRAITTAERRIEHSTYLVLAAIAPGVHRLEVELS